MNFSAIWCISGRKACRTCPSVRGGATERSKTLGAHEAGAGEDRNRHLGPQASSKIFVDRVGRTYVPNRVVFSLDLLGVVLGRDGARGVFPDDRRPHCRLHLLFNNGAGSLLSRFHEATLPLQAEETVQKKEF